MTVNEVLTQPTGDILRPKISISPEFVGKCFLDHIWSVRLFFNEGVGNEVDEYRQSLTTLVRLAGELGRSAQNLPVFINLITYHCASSGTKYK